MIQFNLKRFGKLACWTLTNDKRYFIKSFLQMFVILLLIFLFFTMLVNGNSADPHGYKSCTISIMAILGVDIIVGPALMFYSMEGKHDMQTLMMLPASNFEKYLVRYAHWLVLLPCYLVTILGADLIQYLIHLVAGHDYARFVTSVLINDVIGDTLMTSAEVSHPRFLSTLIVLVIWFQSLYALGATLFRTRKFNWVITTMAIILLGIVIYKIQGVVEAVSLDNNSTTMDYAVGYGIYLVWVILNYWLSYRCFCRTQVISKWVNL